MWHVPFASELAQGSSLRVRLLRGAEDQRVLLEGITAFQQAIDAAGCDTKVAALPEGGEAPPWSGPAFETVGQATLEAAIR